MAMAPGWMVLALAFVGQPEGHRGGVPIEYRVSIVDVEGLGWRDAAFPRLTPVSRQGSATIWTAPASVAKRLAGDRARNAVVRMTRAPKVTAWAGAPAHVSTRTDRQFVTHVSWEPGDATSSGSRNETVRTGTVATIAGRKMDQGILVKMVLQDTQVLNVHLVKLTGDRQAPKDPATSRTSFQPASGEDKEACCKAASAKKKEACCTASEEKATAAAKFPMPIAPAGKFSTTGGLPELKPMGDDVPYLVEVPEIGDQEVAGEWLIPKDGVLLVSFGPHTIADRDGKAVIHERLAIVEAAESASPIPPPATARPTWSTPSMSVPALPAAASATRPAVPAPAAVAAMPPMPSRSIPQGYHKNGKPAELPVLPEDAAEADTDTDDDSAETRPTPQSKKPRPAGESAPAKPESDAAMKKTQYVVPSSFPVIPTLFQPAPTVGLQFLVPIKPIAIRLPFNRRMEIEVYGRIVRAETMPGQVAPPQMVKGPKTCPTTTTK